MPIPEKELRAYIYRRHVGDRFQPMPPTGQPAAYGGPVSGRKVNGPQLTAARPILEKIENEELRKKVETFLFTFPLLNVLEMITNPANEEFRPHKEQMLELAEAIIGPEYKKDTPPEKE